MRDIVFVLLTIGFFALAAAYISACARIVGRDDVVAAPSAEDEMVQEVLG